MEDFVRVEKTSISDNIIEQIQTMIENGTLNPGDKLPSERELSEKLGVSRVPIREALKILQFINVIEAQQGSNYTIKGMGRARLLDLLQEVSNKKYDNILEDLKEIRITIEARAARLACERRTEQDLAELKNAVEKMKKAYKRSQNNYRRVIDKSVDFHNCIMKACHNELFFVIYAYINDLIREGRIKTLSIPNRYEGAMNEHEAIYLAIKDRDAEKAAQLIEDHIQTSY